MQFPDCIESWVLKDNKHHVLAFLNMCYKQRVGRISMLILKVHPISFMYSYFL